MSEQVMHYLGLEVDGPIVCKTKLANSTNVHYVRVIKALKVKILGIEVLVDVFVSICQCTPLKIVRPSNCTLVRPPYEKPSVQCVEGGIPTLALMWSSL